MLFSRKRNISTSITESDTKQVTDYHIKSTVLAQSVNINFISNFAFCVCSGSKQQQQQKLNS